MMKNILLVIAIILFPTIIQGNNLNIKWKNNIKVNNITIRSTETLSYNKIRNIKFIYNNSKYLFLNKFEKNNCNKGLLGELKIGIVSANILRNRRYFKDAIPTNFGRYFSETNELYILDSFLDNPEHLAHELAHHYYDECKIKTPNHKRVYDFQDLYSKIYVFKRIGLND